MVSSKSDSNSIKKDAPTKESVPGAESADLTTQGVKGSESEISGTTSSPDSATIGGSADTAASTKEIKDSSTTPEKSALEQALLKKLSGQDSSTEQSLNSAALAQAVSAITTGTVQNSELLKEVASKSLSTSLEQSVLKIGEVKGGNVQSFLGSGEFGGTRASKDMAPSENPRSKSIPRAAVNEQLNKVENALKEVAKSKDGKTISVRLDPPQLGSVKIDVTAREGGIHARLVASASQVNTLLQEKAPDLQVALRKLGLNVDTITVSVQSDGSQFSGNEFNSSNGGSTGRENNTNSAATAGMESSTLISATTEPEHTVLDHWVA